MAETKAKKESKKNEEKRKWAAQQKVEALERKVKKWIKIVIGLLVCTGGVWLIALFWQNFLTVFKEWVGPVAILIGLFIILLGMLE